MRDSQTEYRRKQLDEFIAKNGRDNYATEELANEYGKLKKLWWGSNLVFLGSKQNADGTWSPMFNVYD